jgi:hypothetical protein
LEVVIVYLIAFVVALFIVLVYFTAAAFYDNSPLAVAIKAAYMWVVKWLKILHMWVIGIYLSYLEM